MSIGLSGPPTIRSAVPTWQVLKQYLEEQIGTGAYPVGAWLPSVRELAAQLSVNRNTVSKVYQALGREGVLEVERGKGVRVAQRPSETRSSATRIDGGIHALVREAALAGLSREWLLTRVTDIADETYGNRLVRAAFIECTPPDARQIAADLSRQLEVPVAAIDLADFLADPERTLPYDLVTTTFFHLQEVTAAIPEVQRPAVVGIHHTVSHESVLQIARLRPESTIVIVCPNQRSLDRVRGIVETYARGQIYGVTTEDPAKVRSALAIADVVVDMSLTHDAVAELAPETPAITVSFHIERQSVDYLRDAVHRVARSLATRDGASPAGAVGADGAAQVG